MELIIFAHMKSKLNFLFGSLVIFVLLSCNTSTKITAHWADKNYEKGKISKVLILGITASEAVRRTFEHDMIERLEYIGVDGIASSDIFPMDQKLDSNTFRLHFNNEGFDVVITSKLVSSDKEQNYQAGSSYGAYGAYGGHRGFYGNYGSAYDSYYSPGYSYTTTTLKIETKVYDTKTEQMIWTAISDTFDPSDETDAIKSLNRKLVYELEKQGYFAKKKK